MMARTKTRYEKFWSAERNKDALQEELKARIEAMAVTDDVPEAERRDTALQDIIDLSAKEHGAYTKDEISSWNAIRALARRQLHGRRR